MRFEIAVRSQLVYFVDNATGYLHTVSYATPWPLGDDVARVGSWTICSQSACAYEFAVDEARGLIWSLSAAVMGNANIVVCALNGSNCQYLAVYYPYGLLLLANGKVMTYTDRRFRMFSYDPTNKTITYNATEDLVIDMPHYSEAKIEWMNIALVPNENAIHYYVHYSNALYFGSVLPDIVGKVGLSPVRVVSNMTIPKEFKARPYTFQALPSSNSIVTWQSGSLGVWVDSSIGLPFEDLPAAFEVRYINGTACPNDCSLVFGTCKLDGSCSCAANRYGLTCSEWCTREEKCFGHGSCASNGSCNCDAGWTGPSCASKTLPSGLVLLPLQLLPNGFVINGP